MSDEMDFELEAFDDEEGDEYEAAEAEVPDEPHATPTAPQSTSVPSPRPVMEPTTTGPTAPGTPRPPVRPLPPGSLIRGLAWATGILALAVGMDWDLDERGYESGGDDNERNSG